MNTFVQGLRKYPQLLLGSVAYSIPFAIATLIIGAVLFAWLIQGQTFYAPWNYVIALGMWAGATLAIATIITLPLTMIFAFRLLRFAAGPETNVRALFGSKMHVRTAGLIASGIFIIALLIIAALRSLGALLLYAVPDSSYYVYGVGFFVFALSIVAWSASLVLILGLAFKQGTVRVRLGLGWQDVRSRKLGMGVGILIGLALLAMLVAAVANSAFTLFSVPVSPVLSGIISIGFILGSLHLISPIVISAFAWLGTYEPKHNR